MSYHVLARKWRPQTFADLVGQTHVVKALTYALSHQQIHHAYLFTGTRGVGKTSIARIFAKSLNCERNGISPNPCGDCETCREIKAGKFVDLIEVDAASRTGVEETRELIDSVAYLPSKGRYKVYLIDEVHMFSKSSFNALLKTLEEPPEHVKFILATTDPEKLPITILSRCLQFNLKSLTKVQIRQHLANICQAESIEYDKEALALLASAGDGSMRDTLSMTDQAIAYGHGELRLSAVTEILGTIQPNDIEAILFAIATNNPNQLNQALHRLDNYEVDARAFLIEIMHRLQRMAWAKEGIVENLSPALLSTVNDIPKPLLHLWYDIAEKALPNLSIAGEPRQAVEMALLRMLAFIPSDWVVRHRTLLDTTDDSAEDSQADDEAQHDNINTISDKAGDAEILTEPLPDASNAHHAAETTPPAEAPTLAKPVHATPVVERDSLASAEADFSGESADNPKEIETDKVETDIDEIDIETSESTSQTNTDDGQDAWQLAREENSEPAPNLDELKSLMQSGRDISPPPPSAAPAAVEDTPPWESAQPHEEAVAPIAPSVQEVPQDAPKDSSARASENQPPVATVDTQQLEAFDWHKSIDELALGDYTYHLASLGILRLQAINGQVLATLDLSPKHELLVTDDSLKELSQALEKALNAPITVQVHLTALDEMTPHERQKRNSEKRQADLQQQFSQEPLTEYLLQQFDGEILGSTIKAKPSSS